MLRGYHDGRTIGDEPDDYVSGGGGGDFAWLSSPEAVVEGNAIQVSWELG